MSRTGAGEGVTPAPRRIDCHVHVVGTGLSGSGCWYRPRGITRFGAPLLLRAMQLPRSALRGDLERLYTEQLLRFIRESSLDAAVILAQDEPYTESGEIIANTGSFFVPNDYVLGLARTHRELVPAVSIHPARRDALDELERCLEAGAVMLKCLPNCQNIDWNNPRYTRFLERMAGSGLILLAHTGSERTLPVLAPQLESPGVLTRALEIGVTCIAAHSGTSVPLIDKDHFDVFLGMLKRFPKLYGDNSALGAPNFRLWRSRARALTRPEVAAQMLHGSDLPVPVGGASLWGMGAISFRDWGATARIANPIERDVQLKRALGFPQETFTRLSGLLRR